jgi:photosystem II stability/assembly factor-like uncharacterized protein
MRIVKSTIFSLFFVLYIYCGTSYAQTYWVSHPSPTTKNLTKSLFVDSLYGWVIGDSGIVLRTTNAGTNWEIQPANAGNSVLYDLTFVSRTTGWIISLDSVFRTSILHTTNSGLNWSKSYYPDSTLILSTIFFVDELTGYVSGYNGMIYKTTNNGLNWNSCYIDTTSCLYLFPKKDIYFINAQTGYTVGGALDIQGLFTFTTNGGNSWYSMCIAPEPLNMILSAGGEKIFLMGGDYDLGSIVCVSTDFGENWSYEPTDCFGNAENFAFRTPREVWAALGFQRGFTVNLDSMKPGSRWQCIPSPVDVEIHDVEFLSEELGYAFGYEGTILKYNPAVIGISGNQNTVPDQYELHQNYPNPFNPATKITFSIPLLSTIPLAGRGKDAEGRRGVSLRIYDALGKEIETLVNADLNAGTHNFEWNASNYPSGVYFYKLEAGEFSQSRKMVLIK